MATDAYEFCTAEYDRRKAAAARAQRIADAERAVVEEALLAHERGEIRSTAFQFVIEELKQAQEGTDG